MGEHTVPVVRYGVMVMVVVVVMLVAIAALGASLAVVETAKPEPNGRIHGYVWTLIGPAVGYGKARFTATVEIAVSGHVVASDRVPPGAQFTFTEPGGSYTIGVVGHPSCSSTVELVAHRVLAARVTCTPYRGGPAPGLAQGPRARTVGDHRRDPPTVTAS